MLESETQKQGKSTPQSVDNQKTMERTDAFKRSTSISRTPPEGSKVTTPIVRTNIVGEKEKNNVNQEKQPQARFLVIQRVDGGDFFKTSPFGINKALNGLVGELKQIKKIRQGLLVETVSQAQSGKLQSVTKLLDFPVSVLCHTSLNISKGVVYSRELLCCTEEEILNELKSVGVTAVKRIKSRIRGQLQDTASHILTFNTPKLPNYIKAGYLNLSVRQYIPPPLRCFKCQKFGHTAVKCDQPQICICGKPLHEGKSCDSEVLCVNCSGNHTARSRDCPTYKTEVAIQELKVKEKITYPEARKKVVINTPRAISYAKATAIPETKENFSIKNLVKELIPSLIKELKSVFVSKEDAISLNHYRKESVSSIVSEAPSEKRKRETINTAESSDGEESAFEQETSSQKLKKPKGWPKGKSRKPPNTFILSQEQNAEPVIK